MARPATTTLRCARRTDPARCRASASHPRRRLRVAGDTVQPAPRAERRPLDRCARVAPLTRATLWFERQERQQCVRRDKPRGRDLNTRARGGARQRRAGGRVQLRRPRRRPTHADARRRSTAIMRGAEKDSRDDGRESARARRSRLAPARDRAASHAPPRAMAQTAISSANTPSRPRYQMGTPSASDARVDAHCSQSAGVSRVLYASRPPSVNTRTPRHEHRQGKRAGSNSPRATVADPTPTRRRTGIAKMRTAGLANRGRRTPARPPHRVARGREEIRHDDERAAPAASRRSVMPAGSVACRCRADAASTQHHHQPGRCRRGGPARWQSTRTVDRTAGRRVLRE